MDVNQFCRFNILQIFKLYILQSSQKCRFSCSAASHYYASNMAESQLSFAEKLFKFIFIYLHLCFTFEYNAIGREVFCLLIDHTMQCTSIIMKRFSKSTCTRTYRFKIELHLHVTKFCFCSGHIQRLRIACAVFKFA